MSHDQHWWRIGDQLGLDPGGWWRDGADHRSARWHSSRYIVEIQHS